MLKLSNVEAVLGMLHKFLCSSFRLFENSLDILGLVIICILNMGICLFVFVVI